MTMSDVRAGSYCEVVSQEVPAHRCLCWEAPRHVGEHRCLCGHVWGVAWAEMSYDEQRAFLGLPDVLGYVLRYRMDGFAHGLAEAVVQIKSAWNQIAENFEQAARQMQGMTLESQDDLEDEVAS